MHIYPWEGVWDQLGKFLTFCISISKCSSHLRDRAAKVINLGTLIKLSFYFRQMKLNFDQIPILCSHVSFFKPSYTSLIHTRGSRPRSIKKDPPILIESVASWKRLHMRGTYRSAPRPKGSTLFTDPLGQSFRRINSSSH
jgi:hypothetical protein